MSCLNSIPYSLALVGIKLPTDPRGPERHMDIVMTSMTSTHRGRGISSSGRALALRARGSGIDTPILQFLGQRLIRQIQSQE